MELKKQLLRAYRIYLRNRNWRRIVRMMAAVVVFCTTYALILPAITEETGLVCGLTEHTHDESCYESLTLTDAQGHVHTDMCYQEITVQNCKMEETSGHIHAEACYGPVESLCCSETSEDHEHTQDCYQSETGLVCGQEETEGHTHDEQCYTWQINCELEETSGHTHSDDCYGSVESLSCDDVSEDHEHVATCYLYETGLICGLEEAEGHTHGQDCGEYVLTCELPEKGSHIQTEDCFRISKELICTMEEQTGGEQTLVLVCGMDAHVHDEYCYGPTEPEESQSETLPEGNPEADLETAAQWEASFETLELSGDWSEDLVALAKTQLGYTESKENYILAEDGSVFGYTRYGQWYEEPYAPWDGLFVSFCLHYAGVEGIEPELDYGLWLEMLNEQELYQERDQYQPVPGDLIFLDWDEDGNCDHVGIVETVTEATEEVPAVVQFIAGDWDDRVDRCEAAADGETILGYVCLPTEPEETELEDIEPEDTESHLADGQLQVFLAEDTEVPADAVPVMKAITEENAIYTEVISQVESAVEGDVQHISLLDISFYDQEENYLPVKETATVCIPFDADAAQEVQVKVFHFVDGVAVELEKVTLNSISVLAEDTDIPAQTQLIFETEGFSVFAVVEIASPDITDVTTTPVTELSGEYYIVRNQNNSLYAMLAESKYTYDGSYRGLKITDPITDPEGLTGYTAWTFEPVAAGEAQYRISAVVDGTKKYIKTDYATDQAAHLDLVDTEANATIFTVQKSGNYVVIRCTVDGKTYYINPFGGAGTAKSFAGWHEGDGGSLLELYALPPNNTNNLDGKIFALVSNAQDKAITANPATVNGVSGLASQAVTVTTANDQKFVSGDIPMWTFETTDTESVYHIYTEVDGVKKYLRLLDTSFDSNNPDGRGSLTVGDTAQPITVIANEDGTVYLTFTNENAKTGYINLDQSGTGDFWVYNAEVSTNKLLLCEELEECGLFYDLNAPSGNDWYSGNEPDLASAFQEITAEGVELQTVQEANRVGAFVYNTLAAGARGTIEEYYNTYNDNLGDNLTADNYLAPGAEWRFLGWKATVDGAEYLFPENAAATVDSDGFIHVVDVDNVERVLLPNTTLTGQWKKISEVLLFFVNFGDTMLENMDNKPIVGYGANYYTNVVAIAHIYDPVTISPGRVDNKDTILKENDKSIQAEIKPKYDPTSTGTQIVIDAVAKYNETTKSFDFSTVSNYNQLKLEASVAEYLRNNTNSNTQIKLDDAYVDRSEITSDNYKLYWYLQKAVDRDGWHIDGVLVAKTQPIKIYKTFSGLTRTEAETAINQMTFPLYLIHQNSSNEDTKDDYKTLEAAASEAGVYTANGWDGDSNVYTWTLNAVKGQRYAFEERGYDLTGYDCSSLVSVHFRSTTPGVPGKVVWKEKTDQTYTDISTSANTITDLFASDPLLGDQVERIIFANFYTPTGTGMFSISKVADEIGQDRRPGAKFQLSMDGEVIAEVTTNNNGSAHFSNLEPGTYILKETQAPEGYQKIDTTWTVEVTKTGDVVTVTIQKEGSTTVTELYDSSDGGLQEVYLIQNVPESTTVTVNKQFRVISDAERAQLTNYRIEITDADGKPVDTLQLSDAVLSTGVYSWTVNLECDSSYTFTEYDYSHQNYLDTVVSAMINGSAATVTKSNSNTTASFTMTKSQSADTVNITNTYSNTFDLQILKVDATNAEAPMAGVYFNIYGDFRDGIQVPEGTSPTITYGDGQIAYYVGKTAETDASGKTRFEDMKLSSGSDTFLYVIDEAQTPAGYVKLNEPIVQIVRVNGGDDNYHNGVYTLKVPNYKSNLATVKVTATKVWDLPEGMAVDDCPEVTMTLYKRITRMEDATATHTYTKVRSQVLNKENGWQAVWENLPYAEANVRNEYFVCEDRVAGFATGYSTQVHHFEVGTADVNAAIAEGGELDRSVTVTNSTGPKLPDTGGVGEWLFGTTGLMLMAAAQWQGWLKVKKSKARGHVHSQ